MTRAALIAMATVAWDMFDIASGDGSDCNGDFVRDDCIVTADCDANEIDDSIDIACHGATDTNSDGIPDDCQGVGTWYVDVAAAPGGDGSLLAPFQHLAAAFNVAADGGAISVAPGLYIGPANRNLNFAGRDLTVKSSAGWATCILDLQGTASSAFVSMGGDNKIRLQGLTVQNAGNAQYAAAAIEFENATVVIESCRFLSHTGSAIWGIGDLELIDSVFRSNDGGFYDGAVYHRGSLTALRCLFDDNRSSWTGGAIGLYGEGRESHLSQCVFVGNVASSGSAVWFDSAEMTIDGCLFFENGTASDGATIRSAGFGGGLGLVIRNSTIVNNNSQYGGAVAGGSRELVLQNSILWGNLSGGGLTNVSFTGGFGFIGDSPNVRVERCNLEGGLASVFVVNGALVANDITNADPMFVNAGAGNYRLDVGSPCIDAGSNFFLPRDRLDVDGDFMSGETLGFDLDGNARQVDDPLVPDTGAGSKPMTDLGAFER